METTILLYNIGNLTFLILKHCLWRLVLPLTLSRWTFDLGLTYSWSILVIVHESINYTFYTVCLFLLGLHPAPVNVIAELTCSDKSDTEPLHIRAI